MEKENEIMWDRQYFCSELVAKALKILGLFKDRKKSCTQYFPGCFQDGGQLEKDLNVKLSPTANILVVN